MPMEPTYEELKKKNEELQNEVNRLRSTEKDLREKLGKHGIEVHEQTSQTDDEKSFLLLDEEDIDFAIADKKIQILEAYEYYLSQTNPISTMLNNAINEFPVLEPIFGNIISGTLSEMDPDKTYIDILNRILELVKGELAELEP